MTTVITPAEAAIRIRKLPSELEKAERNAGRRASRKLRATALARFTATGIGHAIFGSTAARGRTRRRNMALRAVFPTPRVESTSEGQIRISYQLRGTAAMVDQGGKTSPHVIKPYGGSGVMAIAVKGGGTIFRTYPKKPGGRLRSLLAGLFGRGGDPKGINHPGSIIPRTPFLDASGHETIEFLAPELDAAYQKAADETVG